MSESVVLEQAIPTHEYEALIVGAGGAGLFAALELARAGVRAAVITKLYPTRSHTGAAQGGVCAALGNQEEDHWEWHMFDTVKGGDYLVDQDAAEVLAREAIETVIELEHMGLPFNRTPDGKIDQRRFGGHTRNYGEGPVKRSCFAADRTGHMILQTLYQQCVKAGVRFYDEYHVVDLLFAGGDAGEGGRAAGVVAYRIADGTLVTMRSKAAENRAASSPPRLGNSLRRCSQYTRQTSTDVKMPARRPCFVTRTLPICSSAMRSSTWSKGASSSTTYGSGTYTSRTNSSSLGGSPRSGSSARFRSRSVRTPSNRWSFSTGR